MDKNVPKRRFKEFNEQWNQVSLGEILNYEQPDKYIVKNDNYSDNYKTPVLTAGQSLLLGHTNEKNNIKKGSQNPVIIFDDFTTSSHYINYDFKIKSSAMKLLNSKPNSDLYFSSLLLKNVKYEVMNHGRHWISIYSNINVKSPKYKEQKQIGDFFQKLDNMIELQSNKIKKYELLKESYLEKMLPEKSQNVPELRFKNFNYEWEKLVFKEQFKVSQGLQIPINERYTTSGIGKYFYITIEFLKDNNMKKYYIKEPNKTVVSNMTDILMVRTGNVGVVLTDIIGCFHNNFFKVDYNRKEFYQYYLYHKFTSPKFQRKLLANSGSSTIPDLSHTSFYSIEEFFPMFEEQKKIGDFFQKIDNIIELQNEKLDKLKNLKQAYLNEMFVN